MAIKLILTKDREVLRFYIRGKEIFYSDKIWSERGGGWVRCIPKDENFIKKILLSRNKLPKLLIRLFDRTKEEMEEYNNAKTEDDLADIIIKDAKVHGVLIQKRIRE